VKDTFGRKIEYLRLSITDRCNLRCRYCMPAHGVETINHEDVLSYEELMRIAYVATRCGVKKIRVTGGEPLVRRGIVDFIRELATLPTKPEITLTTNGILLADMAADLRRAGIRAELAQNFGRQLRGTDPHRRSGAVACPSAYGRQKAPGLSLQGQAAALSALKAR